MDFEKKRAFRKKDLWVKITQVNLPVFEIPKIAHNSLNDARRAVLTLFLDIDIFRPF